MMEAGSETCQNFDSRHLRQRRAANHSLEDQKKGWEKRCGNRPLGHIGSYSVGIVSGNHHLENPKPAPDSFESLGSKNISEKCE
ncbi:Uncharacterized protein DAT39_006233, partial [Clarias magur]